MFLVRSVCLSICLSVCPSDYSQTCERILMKFFGGVGHGSRTKWYNFGGDPVHASDPGVQSPKSGSSGSAEVCALWVLLVHIVSVCMLVCPSVQQRTSAYVGLALQTTWLAISVSSNYRRPCAPRGSIWCSWSLLVAEVQCLYAVLNSIYSKTSLQRSFGDHLKMSVISKVHCVQTRLYPDSSPGTWTCNVSCHFRQQTQSHESWCYWNSCWKLAPGI